MSEELSLDYYNHVSILPDDHVLNRLKEQRSEIDLISIKWLELETNQLELKLAITKGEHELIDKRKYLNELEEKIRRMEDIEDEVATMETNLQTTLTKIEDQILASTSQIRQQQRASLEKVKQEVRQSFLVVDAEITASVQPILDKINHNPNLSRKNRSNIHQLIPPICQICAKQEGPENSEETFNRRVAIIPCGHNFCMSCAEYAYERERCHICNQIPDGILTLF